MSDWVAEGIARQNEARKAYSPPLHGVREWPGYFARLAWERKQPDRETYSFRMHGSMHATTLATGDMGTGLTE